MNNLGVIVFVFSLPVPWFSWGITIVINIFAEHIIHLFYNMAKVKCTFKYMQQIFLSIVTYRAEDSPFSSWWWWWIMTSPRHLDMHEEKKIKDIKWFTEKFKKVAPDCAMFNNIRNTCRSQCDQVFKNL